MQKTWYICTAIYEGIKKREGNEFINTTLSNFNIIDNYHDENVDDKNDGNRLMTDFQHIKEYKQL